MFGAYATGSKAQQEMNDRFTCFVDSMRSKTCCAETFAGHLPSICAIDFTSPADVAQHDRMVALVERTAEGVELHRKLAAGQVPHVKTALQRYSAAHMRSR